MSEDFKKKDSDHQTEGPENRPENRHEGRPENKAAREVSSIDSTIMNLIAKKRTNSSSGSLDESQDHSLEIDFGGSVESRKNRLPSELLAQAKEPTVFKPMPIPSIEVRRPGDAPTPLTDLTAPSDLINSRTELKRLVEAKIQSPSERKQFLDDIDHFEANFDQRSGKSSTGKLREMADTYAQLSRLLSADTDILAKYPQCQLKEGETPWRVRVAEQIIHQAAEPFTISQGKLAVCAAASLEVREYYREPAAVARLVTDVLLTGKYEATAGGTKVDLTKCPDNLIPDPFSKQFSVEKEVKGEPIYVWNLPYSDARSFASQLFEVTAINLVLQPRGYRYEQPVPSDYARVENRANGKTVDIRTHEAKPWGSGENRTFGDAEIASAAYKITGKDEGWFVISAGSLTQREAATTEIRKIYEFDNRDLQIQNVFSPTEVLAALRRTREQDEWPPIVRIDASLKPVNQTKGGAHFLVISDISANGIKLSFDNSWEETRDRNGEPTTPVAEIAASILSNNISPGAANIALLSRVDYFHNHPGLLKLQIKNWLEIPNKIKSAQPPVTPAEYERQHPDPELKDWIARHPDDNQLTWWKSSIEKWLDKYPAERPNH
ncbi:hypothetical protein KBI23_13020 [bacterium]|nr:hypothetical protein [bacterium]MBP9810256.1 hypothetical protein [bacterium]